MLNPWFLEKVALAALMTVKIVVSKNMYMIPTTLVRVGIVGGIIAQTVEAFLTKKANLYNTIVYSICYIYFLDYSSAETFIYS